MVLKYYTVYCVHQAAPLQAVKSLHNNDSEHTCGCIETPSIDWHDGVVIVRRFRFEANGQRVLRMTMLD